MGIEVGKLYRVTVVKILHHGIIVQIDNTADTEFIHISKLSHSYISNISDVISVGDVADALCINSGGRVELSLQHTQLPGMCTKSQTTHTTSSIDDMIAAADCVLQEKQLAYKNRLTRKHSSKRKNR